VKTRIGNDSGWDLNASEIASDYEIPSFIEYLSTLLLISVPDVTRTNRQFNQSRLVKIKKFL
jgi:hypothetical protein